MKRILPPYLFILSLFVMLTSFHQLKAQWVIYSADVLPDAFTESPFIIPTPAGTFSNTIVDDPDINNNKLLYMTTADNSSNFLWRRNYGTSPARENITVVVRAKAKTGSTANMVFEMDVEWAGTRSRIFILTNGSYRREVPGPSATASMGDINVYDWNIYRFTKSGNQVRLYVNENEVAIFDETTATSVSNHHFRIGDLWGSGHINTEIDWIVWDPTVAHSPQQGPLPDGLTGVNSSKSDEKEILSFILNDAQVGDAAINTTAGTVTVVVPQQEDVTNVIPQLFTISEKATIDPPANSAQNFTLPVVYTVTAEDNSTKQWTITVNTIDPNESLVVYPAEEAQFTGTISTAFTGYTGSGYVDFLSSGDNAITFAVCQTDVGARTAKFRYAYVLGDDETERAASLYVNDVLVSALSFPPTTSNTDWTEISTALTLPSGVSTIRLTWGEDGPNLDKLTLGGETCESFLLTVTATNDGEVVRSPARSTGSYFSGETVTLLVVNKPDRVFVNWSGDVTGTDNPVQVVMNGNRAITALFDVVTVYELDVAIVGSGNVTLNPPGGVYAEGTEVTLTANAVFGATFEGWSGDLSGTSTLTSLVMNANKSVTATFGGAAITLNFETPVGFASVVTGAGAYNFTSDTFYGPTNGGQGAADTLWINGPEEFDILAKAMYNRRRAYNNASQSWGGTMQMAPLVMVLKEGIYTAGATESSAWNSGQLMMRVQAQGDLTIIGQGNVVMNWGFSLIDSWNILIRNISFQDYYDDGITVDGSHHVWIDHCTFGHPTTRPTNQDHPDGGVDVKAGSNYVTISWSVFRNSWKTNLIGHSDNNGSEDSGKLKTTLYANHYVNSNSRNPRVRFGEVHVLNNLMERLTLYGIAAANQSQVYAENNFYLNTRWPMYADRSITDFRAVYGNNTDNVFTSKTGNIPASGLKAVGNAIDDSGLPLITAQLNPDMLNASGRSIKFDEFNAENVFNPSAYYTYTPYDASVIRTLIPLYAGSQRVDFFGNATTNDGEILITASLQPFTQTIGSPSETQTYTVSAADISGNLAITPPAGFQVSANQSTWFDSGSPLTITFSAGSVTTTTVYVRLNAEQANTYSGNIAHTATGALPVLTDVSGTAELAPGTVPVGNWIIYEADVLPNAFTPAFVTSQQTGVFSNAIIPDPDREGNNLLRITTTDNSDGTNDNNQWRQNVTAGLQNITIVIRARGTDSEKDMVFDMDIDFNSLRWQMRILPNGDFMIPNGTPNTSGTIGVDPLQWNTYRFVRKGNETALYINENPNPVYMGTAAAAGANNYFRFGDGWGQVEGVGRTIATDFDFVVWDVTGGFSPAETSLPASLLGGEVTPPTPTLAVTGTLQSFSQLIGSPSDLQTYSISGSTLTEEITITPPAGYEVSADAGATWFTNSSALVINPENGAVPSTTIQVRLNATEAGNYAGDIMHTSEGAQSVSLSVIGEAEVPPITPSIVLTGSPSAFSQFVDIPSPVRTYSISALSLTGDVTITPPSPFEISTDGITWITSASSIVLTQTDGAVANTTVSIRLNASGAGFYEGDIEHTSPGATTQRLTVSGTTTVAPNTGTWSVYEANELPNEFPLSPFVVAGATSGVTNLNGVNTIISDSEIEGNNLLKLLVPAEDAALTSYQWRQNVTATEMTVVFRVKGEPGRAIALDVDMDFATTRSRISLRTDDKRAQVRNGTGGTGTVTLSDLTMTEWNTFRFTKTNTEVQLFVNESTTPILTSVPVAAGGNNYFRFGDGDNGAIMGGYIDWVAWDMTGAYSPVQKSLPSILGDTNVPDPVLATVGIVSAFSQIIGTPSAIQTYTVSGANLTDNITITPPDSYEISVNGTTWFTSTTPLVLQQSEGTVASTSISVRLNAATAGEFSGPLTHSSSGATSVTINISGMATAPPLVPVLTIAGSLDSFSQTVGTPSDNQSYTLSGSNLTGNITITPPNNFQVSSDGGTTWGTNAAPLTLVPTGGVVGSTPILVRLNATTGGTFSGTISHLSPGAVSVSTAVTGDAEVVTSLHETSVYFSFAPNPVHDWLTIKRNDAIAAVVSVYSTTGINVSVVEIQDGVEEFAMDLRDVATGVYFIQYTTKKGMQTLRLLKN